MKVHHALPESRGPHARPLVVAIGVFDGFHLGHRALVREAFRLRRPGERSAVLTFRDHPAAYLRPGAQPPMIFALEERINAFARAGIDEAFVLPFDDGIASLEPEQFLADVLVRRLGAVAMIVGANFRFGRGRAGDAAFARAWLDARGYRFAAVPNVVLDGERVSSTRVRALIAAGDVPAADRLLGYPYTLRGRVTIGHGRGHDLGFPTANLALQPRKLLPPDGVYACVGRHDGRDYPGLVSIGTNPTFDGTERTVEVWLLDFQGACYGEEVAIRDLRFVRGQRRFDSVEELVAQMEVDRGAVGFPAFGV